MGVVARSYRTVFVLAAFIALWALAAYEWLGLPAESSALLMILSFIWAIVQLLAAAFVVWGTIAGAVETAATEGRSLPLRWLWTMGRYRFPTALIFGLMSLVLVWLCGVIFGWINAHSVEVASFLTFHSGKPVSHVRIEKIYDFIEWLWWTVFSGFLLSFFIALWREGWRASGKANNRAPRRMRLPDSLSDEPAERGGVRRDSLRTRQLASRGPGGILGLHADGGAIFFRPSPHFRWRVILVALPGRLAGLQAGHATRRRIARTSFVGPRLFLAHRG